MAGPIICGVDDSLSARGAARVARALGRQLGLTLIFVRVVKPEVPSANVNALAERLERLSAEATDVDCGASWLVDVGHPADRLVVAAKVSQASFIVIGSRGPRSSILGSAFADVSRRAPCPVVIVPAGADLYLNDHRGAVDAEYVARDRASWAERSRGAVSREAPKA